MNWLSRSFRIHALAALLIIGVTALIEFLMGRLPICKCGYVLPWYNYANGPGNSQHLADWYTFSHIVHGILFYWFIWLISTKIFRTRLPMQTGLILAIIIECAWEILENSPLIIDRYRTATMALDYYGDSIINSVMDCVWMILGFLIAWRIRWQYSFTLIIALELFAAYFIRDNLTLNVIMLIFPIESVKVWQSVPRVAF